MNDDTSRDPLLDLLARTAKEMKEDETTREEERWQRWAEGTLDPEEAAALDEAARSSVPARRMAETYRPLGDEFQERVVAALRAQPGGGAEAPDRAAPGRTPAETPPRRLWLATAALVMLAAALSLVFLPSGPPPPLPAYQVALEGGVHTQRSIDEIPADARRYAPGSRWELLLRPASPVEGDVAVACFLARDGDPRPWDPPVEISPAGSVRIAGRIGEEIEIAPGAWTVWIAVARPDDLPTVTELRARLSRAPGEDPEVWSLHRADFVIDTPD